MNRGIYKIVLLSLILFIPLFIFGIDKREYRFITALGADRPFSSGINRLYPILYASYLDYLDDDKNNYWELGATTTTVYGNLGMEITRYSLGIRPIWGHSVYGAYSDYDRGYTDERNEIRGFFFGAELYFKYSINRLFHAGIKYLPDYRYYETDSDANVEEPESHQEHVASLELKLGRIDERDFGLVKHGFIINLKYEYTNRTGYSFQDRPLSGGIIPGISDNPHTQRSYLDAGLYYNTGDDINIKLDLNSSWQKNVDRNNAEKIGYLLADHAVMPGYFYAEFYHNAYAVLRMNLGFSLPAWDCRLVPGFNILYMRNANGVIGVTDYPRTVYKSISLSLFMKVAGIIPLFLDYGYGIDAERRDSPSGKITKGSHEISGFFVVAFGRFPASGMLENRE